MNPSTTYRVFIVGCWLIVQSFPAMAQKGLILPPDTFNPAQILPAPPADDSLEAEVERAAIKAAYADATPEQRAQAQRDAANESLRLFADTIPGFNLDQLPATQALFKTIRANENAQTRRFKRHFNRQRPYQVDTSITPCLPPKNFDVNASDPSGHTTMAFSSAVILADLLPAYAAAIMARAEQYGRHRIICGAHHPFDVRSGQVLGTLIGVTLLKSPELKPQLDAARAELSNKITASTKLQNTEWVATRMNGDAVKGAAPTLTIDQDRAAFRAYGSSGCNRYTGQATLGDKSGLQFGPLASTRMACPGDTDRQEAAYLKALQSVSSYHLNQGDLILLDKDFNKVVEFKMKQESQPR
jgi:acid phosphatase (class A)